MNSALRFCAGRARHELSVFFVTDQTRNRAADFLEIGKVPPIRKIPALLGLDRLNRTIAAFEKHALAVWLLHERQSPAIGPQAGEPLDKIELGQLLELGEAGDFRIAHAHLARPAATGRAALAFVKNRHA